MNIVPLLVNHATLVKSPTQESVDQYVFDDEMPAALDRNLSGYVLSRVSKITEVKQETHDDN